MAFKKGHGVGAPVGNTNARRAKIWTQAIERVLEDRGGGSVREELNKLANKLIEMCLEGDIMAIKELGDRMEGKVSQQVEMTTGEGGFEVTIRASAEELIRKIRGES